MSCFMGGQFYVIPSFDDMPVGTAQWLLERCKIGVHGTTGFHFSPSFLIVCCFLLGSEVQSLCEIVALPFVKPIHTPLHNHSINNCGFKASDPFCSPWRNKHQLLLSPLPTLFLNVGISLEFQRWFPAALKVGSAAWTTQESYWESKNHHSGLVEIIDISLKGLSGGYQKERHFPKANFGSVLIWNLSMMVACSSQACRQQWCICTPEVILHIPPVGQCCTWSSAAQPKRNLPVLWDLTLPLCWPCSTWESKWCPGRRRDTSPVSSQSVR